MMKSARGGKASRRGVFANALEPVVLRVGAERLAGRVPVVVFDLDDTLFLTKNRHLRILLEFAGAADSPAAKRLAAVKSEHLRYNITDTAKAAGVDDEAALSTLRDFWFKRFFTNEYLLEDAPVAGASEFVRAVLNQKGHVVYLTGRDEGMRAGTLGALEKWDFPLPDRPPHEGRVRLMLKPRFDMDDLAYKTEAFEKIAALGSVVAGFENEPSYLAVMALRFPEMTPVLLQTQHSGRPARTPDHAVQVAHFLKA